MKVLLTGATGSLGRAAASAMLDAGIDLTVLQRRPSGLRCREFLGDVADAPTVAKAARGQDAVLHVAAKVDVVGTWAQYERANVQGTRVIVDACIANNVR